MNSKVTVFFFSLALSATSSQAATPTLTCKVLMEMPTLTSEHGKMDTAPNASASQKGSKQISGVKKEFDLYTPSSLNELMSLVKNTLGRISVIGGGFSMGGQVLVKNGVTVDMSKLNKVVELDVKNQTITVQAGATWRQIQEVINPHDLAIKVMQTYNNFSVGGSLSVNVHGRYVGFGPIISTVRELKLLLADGRLVRASREENSELFFGAIGGYGALGIIVEAKLDLAKNKNIERTWQEFSGKKTSLKAAIEKYLEYFEANVNGKEDAVMTNADIYPPNYNLVRAITYRETDKPLTVREHLQKPATGAWAQLTMSYLNSIEQLLVFVKRFRERVYEPRLLAQEKVVTRNWEASMSVQELEPLNEKFPITKRIFGFANRRAVLQEYFIPKSKLPQFAEEMAAIFQKHNVNVTNVSLRHVPKNQESILSWSNEESFALVIYYAQPYGRNVKAEMQKARVWTQEMLDRVLHHGGSYYLPYQLHARADQYRRAYPRHAEFAALKRKYDPQNKFSNYFIDTYILRQETFHFRDMMQTQYNRIEMLEFFRNIFGIIQPDKHMAAIELAYSQLQKEGIELNDRNMYERIQKILPDYDDTIGHMARGASSLRVQQAEMADQTVGLLNAAGVKEIEGYAEFGTPGRYTGYLKGHRNLKVKGPVYIVNDEKPGLLAPTDILERTGGYGALDPRSYTATLWRPKFVDLSNYDTLLQKEIPNNTVGMASMFIGLHHIPAGKLRPFVASIHRIIKPGGYFVLRDHDVNSPELMRMAHLAHSTFNAGLGVSFAGEVAEVRNFQPLAFWVQVLKESGFELVSEKGVLQAGDPTKNTLLLFKKSADFKDPNDFISAAAALDDKVTLQSLNSIPGYHRPDSHTHLIVPEWSWVDVYRAFYEFQAHTPWFFFPFDKYMKWAKDTYNANVEYARRQSPVDRRGFSDYVTMDKFLLIANGVLFGTLDKAAKALKWAQRNEHPPQQTGYVVEGLTPQDLASFSDGLITVVKELGDNLTLVATARQMPFTKAMLELAKKDHIRVLQVAGHEYINVQFATTSKNIAEYQAILKTMDPIQDFQFPTPMPSLGKNQEIHIAKIHVTELGIFLRALEKNNHELMRAHDY